jgi:integrase
MATKNGTSGGSIIQREKDKPKSKCKKWELRVPTGLDPRTGKYKAKSRRFNGSYTEAKRALREFQDEVEGDRVQGKTGYTFQQYCERYLGVREAKREVAPTTQKRQRWQFKAVCRHIGHVKLEQVTPTMLNDMYIAMMRGDTMSGKPSSGSYVNQIHDNITLVFEAAKAEGILTENPCDKVTPPKMDTRAKKAVPPDKARAFIESLDPSNPHELAWLIAATMGLRRGEVCGLSWGDVDFDRKVVSIRHSYDELGNLKGTKTKAGTRLLPLPDITAEGLLTAKRLQAEYFERINESRRKKGKTGPEWHLEQTDETPVVTTKYSERIKPSSLSRWWSTERDAYGLQDFSLHELRHTYLTLLAEEGVHPKVMQELAGHYSSQITMDVYTHVNMDAKREAVAAVSKLF